MESEDRGVLPQERDKGKARRDLAENSMVPLKVSTLASSAFKLLFFLSCFIFMRILL